MFNYLLLILFFYIVIECLIFLAKSLSKTYKKIFYQYDECFKIKKRIEDIEAEKSKNKELYEVFKKNLKNDNEFLSSLKRRDSNDWV